MNAKSMKVIRSLQKNAVTFLIRIQRTLLNIINAQIKSRLKLLPRAGFIDIQSTVAELLQNARRGVRRISRGASLWGRAERP